MDSAWHSSLHEAQADRGAEFHDIDGVLWTATFGDADHEYRAIREATSMLDASPLAKWVLRGSNVAQALRRVFTNDTSRLAVGQVQYGAIVDERGAMVDDGLAYRVRDDELWLISNSRELDRTLPAHTDELAVAVEDASDEWALIAVQGPGCRALLQSAMREDLSRLGFFRFWPEPVELAGVSTWVLRTGVSGEIGYELMTGAEDAPRLWLALEEAGATLVGVDALDIARIECGFVVYGLDYVPGETSPYDVSLDRFVYLGDAELRARDALAQRERSKPFRLVGLTFDSAGPPPAGSSISTQGVGDGRVTSPVRSLLFGSIALAVLPRERADPGTRVTVSSEAGETGASVVSLPFYDPQRERSRG